MDSTTYLDRYQLCRGTDGTPIALQRGPGGVTYQAEDIETDDPVAVKLVPSYSFAPEELQELEKEARAAQQVSHPNVARLHNFGIQGGDVVFVTEVLDGTTLDAWVTEHGPLAPAAVVRVALQVVAGLAAAAFHAVAHRSIQPATLMIVPGQTPEGEWPLVKILNFGGVPATVSATEFSSGRTGRSADFASPEQLKGYPVDFRSEIYSLGCTMWFLLTGAPPVPGTTDKSGVVPRALRPILAQMVALDPMQRPQDPVALQEQLRDCLASLERGGAIGRQFGVATAAAPSVAAVDSIPKATQLLKPLAFAAALLVLIGIGALAWPYIHSSNTASEPIGVPVGVPDKTADAAATGRTAAAPAPTSAPTDEVAAAPRAAVATATPVVAAAASVAPTAIATATPAIAAASVAPTAEPQQALVSVQPPAPGESAAPESAAPVAEGRTSEPAAVAAKPNANRLSPADQSAPAQVAESGGALPPKSDTAAERSASEQSSAQPSSRLQRSRTASAESAPSATVAPTPEATRPAVVKSTPKPASKVARATEVRRAEPPDNVPVDVNAPPVPRGAKRAKYLGTTPDGDLVFGLPSDERGYVAPPRGDNRRRRTRAADDLDQRPATVLPAEPVEPDGGDE